MNFIRPLAERLTVLLNKKRLKHALVALAGTPPIKLDGTSLILLSQVHQLDVWPYLLALKSFSRFVSPKRVIVVCDPSLGEAERDLIKVHVPEVEFRRAEDCRDQDLPTGGTWERLIAIADLVSAGEYVIQLDADTVTLAYPSEVVSGVTAKRSFILATEDGQSIEPCQKTADWAVEKVAEGAHIQVCCEAALADLPNSESINYMRGCSGFTGFAPYSFDRERLRRLSAAMAERLGARWTEWGTEQFSSNFLLSNTPSIFPLPHPKYCHPGREMPETVFLHFIGYVRFATDRYASVTKEVCRELVSR